MVDRNLEKIGTHVHDHRHLIYLNRRLKFKSRDRLPKPLLNSDIPPSSVKIPLAPPRSPVPLQPSMSYRKIWTSFTHKSTRMMTMCSGSKLGQFLSHITVEPVLFLYMLSTFSQYALFQDLVYSKVCWSEFSRDSDICKQLHDVRYKNELEIVQTMSSHWILMSTISLVVPSLLIAVYLGSWSDRFGRKWPVVFPPMGGVCACLVYIVISVVEDSSVGWICLASLLSGLTGGFVTCISSCMTYVASVTTEENRTLRISRLEAMTFLGGTVGPFISGTVLEVTGHAYAFFYMMLCYAFAFLYAILFVKDINKGVYVIDNDAVSRGTRSSSVDPQLENDNDQRKHKSSETIPSSVTATGLTVSAGEDLEQQERLLSVSDLAAVIRSSSVDKISAAVDISRLQPQGPGAQDDKQRILYCSYDGKTAANQHNTNRNSMGSSSGRNSSLHGHDDGSSAASDDDQRNIIRSQHSGDDGLHCCSKYFGMGHVGSALVTVMKPREHGRRSLLLLSLMAGFMFMVITAGEMDVAYLFARADPLKWTYQTYSYFFGFKYGFGALILMVGTPLIQKFKVEDTTLVIVGILSRMAALVVYGLSVNTYMAFSVPAVAVFSVFTIPATRSLLSKLVGSDEQGKMFAFVAMMEDTCTLSASLIFNSIYPLTRPILQGLIFLLASCTLVVPITIMCFVHAKIKKIRKLDAPTQPTTDNLHCADPKDSASFLLPANSENE